MKKLTRDQIGCLFKTYCSCATCKESRNIYFNYKGCPCDEKSNEWCIGCIIKRLRKFHRFADDCKNGHDIHLASPDSIKGDSTTVDILNAYNCDIINDGSNIELMIYDIYYDTEDDLEYYPDEEDLEDDTDF